MGPVDHRAVVRTSSKTTGAFQAADVSSWDLPGNYHTARGLAPVTPTEETERNPNEATGKMSVSNCATASRKVIGVALTADEVHSDKNLLLLGVIVVPSLDVSLAELRKRLEHELPALPPKFGFFTSQGWPLTTAQEVHLRTGDITQENCLIRIRRTFDKPRIGVVVAGGDCLGFLFIELQSCLTKVRKEISEQFRDGSKPKFDYRFRDRNGWPIQPPQEAVLLLLDLVVENNVHIEYVSEGTAVKDNHSTDTMSHVGTFQKAASSQDVTDGIKAKPKKALKKKEEKPQEIAKLAEKHTTRPILISYVRQEAAEHALNLKNELSSMGYSIYLDVHEIKIGTDWQDALNAAVNECYVFVPLITPMYGKTKWTNREVKLADSKNKVIIPINFLEYWPPECLAIQFATTQYIPWKPAEPNNTPGEKNNDLRHWEPVYIKQVCKEIAERCTSTVSRKSVLFRTSYKRDLRENSIGLHTRFSMSAAPRKLIEEDKNVVSETVVELLTKPLIIISAHPKQTLQAYQVKTALECERYDVWCSTELLDAHSQESDAELLPSNPNTPRDLPTIPEGGESVFEEAYDTVNLVSYNERCFSVGQTQGSNSSGGRMLLRRMASQGSVTSQVSSLSQEKMEKLRAFQQKADKAKVVIILASEAYGKSKTCQQQTYYCEHRKKVVVVKVDDCPMPAWFTMLMGNDMISMTTQQARFMNILKGRVKRAVDPLTSETPKDATNEAKIQYLVSFLRQKLPSPIDRCVYIVGSSSVNAKTEAICRAIGQELAKLEDNLCIVTGGFCGAPELVAKAFHHTRESYQRVDMEREALDSCVFHILPFKDTTMDLSSKTTQNTDGSFQPLSYGQTVFAGDSIKERESAVARILDTCIIIEGGPGAAHEAEEFIWNDHFVIPIKSTGGAAEGNFGIPMKIFEVPPGVSTDDWAVLSEKQADPEAVGQAVSKIIQSLKRTILSHKKRGDAAKAGGQPGPNVFPKKTKFSYRPRRSKKVREISFQEPDFTSKESSNTPSTFRHRSNSMEVVEQEMHELLTLQASPANPSSRDTSKPVGRWRKFCHMIQFAKSC